MPLTFPPPPPPAFVTNATPFVLPDQADSILLPSANPDWTYGPWTTIVAANTPSMANAVIVYVFAIGSSASGFDYEVQIGFGNAGQEVFRITVAAYNLNNPHGAPTLFHIFPVEQVPPNSRIAGRCASQPNAGNGARVSLGFLPLPL
jgi:hypothetical protein